MISELFFTVIQSEAKNLEDTHLLLRYVTEILHCVQNDRI